MWAIAALFLGYFCGSIAFGLIISKIMGLGDIRQIGSGNIGATNVLRTGNRKAAALTLLLDALKGFIPVLLARFWPDPDAAALAALGAVLGHVFPVWLKFRGGKAIATTLGSLLALSWILGLAFIAIWLAVALIFHFSSLAALVSMILMPILAWVSGRDDLIITLIIINIIIVATHRTNIKGLFKGKETKINWR